MKKSLLFMLVAALYSNNLLAASQYEGTTSQDFQAGGRFDLSTESGVANFAKFDESRQKSIIANQLLVLNSEKSVLETQISNVDLNISNIENNMSVKEIEFAQLSAAVYGDLEVPSGWEPVQGFDKRNIEINIIEIGKDAPLTGVGSTSENGKKITTQTDTTDFHATLYRNGKDGNLVIAFQGTAGSGDLKDDTAHFIMTPDQYKEAKKFFDEVKAKFPNDKLTLTGHSLGGGLAQYVAALNDVPATTFNPAKLQITTMTDVLLNSPGKFNKITNITFGSDFVSKGGLFPLLGHTKNFGATNGVLYDHSITNFIPDYKSKHKYNIQLAEINKQILTLTKSIATPSTCATQKSYVCSPVLGNIISGITNGNNSAIGAANGLAGWNNGASNITKPTNTNNAQQQTGVQQSALVTNTQAFKSSDWVVTQGDAATNYSIGNSFGTITAPNGGAIAALNNADLAQTVMQKTITIPTGVKQVTVNMMANFVTNEFPQYVGSQFNDRAVIEIKTGSGNVYQATLYNKELNSANFTPVSGLPAPMENIGGQTGFEKVTKTIPVANGGNLTITVKTVNVGDTEVPSATLINSTSVK